MQLDHDQKHREAVTRKLEKIQGLVALLDTWEKKTAGQRRVSQIFGRAPAETAQRPDAVQSNGNR